VTIEGLSGLLFGNGNGNGNGNRVNLGDSDTLCFAAGPEDEAAGLLGSLRYRPRQKESDSHPVAPCAFFAGAP
jgi:hypothetical protein